VLDDALFLVDASPLGESIDSCWHAGKRLLHRRAGRTKTTQQIPRRCDASAKPPGRASMTFGRRP